MSQTQKILDRSCDFIFYKINLFFVQKMERKRLMDKDYKDYLVLAKVVLIYINCVLTGGADSCVATAQHKSQHATYLKKGI